MFISVLSCNFTVILSMFNADFQQLAYFCTPKKVTLTLKYTGLLNCLNVIAISRTSAGSWLKCSTMTDRLHLEDVGASEGIISGRTNGLNFAS